jgi:drug/metabolite transporter (DMT)-like permease
LANLLLIITAAIWGFAFVAQRLGMESLDPFTYNAIRFALGALFVWLVAARKEAKGARFPWLIGVVLFIAASLQQVGIMYTSAGSAGFITGLYVVMVPILGVFRRQKLKLWIVLAVLIATLGMYYINNPDSAEVSFGNLLVLIGAMFFALHVQLVDYYTLKYKTSTLAYSQFALCSLLSLVFAFIWLGFVDSKNLNIMKMGYSIGKAILPILYGGLLSVGVAYTLQIKAQKRAEPGKAAVILCSEGLFALIGGYLVLGEHIGIRTVIGALLLLIAMLVSIFPQLFD